METRKTLSKKEDKEYRRNFNRTEIQLGGIICQESCSEVLLVGTTSVKTHVVKRMIQPTSMESINGNNDGINYEDPVLEETPLAADTNNNANRTQVRRSSEVSNTASCNLEKGKVSVKKQPCDVSSGSKEFSKPNSEVQMSPCVNNGMNRKEMFNQISQEYLNTQQSKNEGTDEKKTKCSENVNNFLPNTIRDTSFKSEHSSELNDVADPGGRFILRNKGESNHALTTSCYGNDVLAGNVQSLVKFFETLNGNKKKLHKAECCTSIENEGSKSLAIDSNRDSSSEKTKSVIPTKDKGENSPPNNQFIPHLTQLSTGLKNEELKYEILNDINNSDIILESVSDKKDQRGSMKSYESTKPNPSSDLTLPEKVMPTRGHQLPKLEVVVNRSTINSRNGSSSARMVNKAVSQSHSGYLSRVRDKPPKRLFTWKFLGCVVCALAFLLSTNFFQSI